MRSILVCTALLTLGCAPRAAGQVVVPDRDRVLTAAREVMAAARYATLVTIGEDGQPEARIVDPFPPEDGLVIWIGTNPLTRKVRQIEGDPRVTLLYFDATGLSYVTLVGRAEPVTDPDVKRRHWKEEWAGFYPDGPQSEGYLLLRVIPSRLEISSSRHGLTNDRRTWRPVILELP